MKVMFSSLLRARRCVYVLLLLAVSGTAIRSHAGKKRVLFLGNSYTYVNNMPQILANMALTTGDTLIYSMYAPGGYTINNHAQDTAATNRIQEGGWDYLVLQEQSQLPSFPVYFSNELSGLCSLFRMHNPCGRIMFFMTWGRKNGDASNCANWPPVCTYLGMDSLIRLRYIEMAEDNHAELSPAGAAWRYARQHHPGIELYQFDESHPSEEGSYLIASSFYAAVFKKDPALVTYNFGLNASVANALKQAAQAVVFDSLAYWDHSPTTPVAQFNYTIGTGVNQANFINQSSHADTYLWNFGDGATSTDKHPVHNYTGNGTYLVTLRAYNCDLDTTYEDTHQMQISFCSFTPAITPLELALCPGTSDTLSTQVYDAYQWYDENYNAVPGATARQLVAAAHNTYCVEATLNGCTERSASASVSIAGLPGLWSIVPAGELAGEDSACAGNTIALVVSYNKPPGAADSLIDWRRNGQPISGYHNDTLLVTQTGLYEATVRHEKCPALDQAKQIRFTFVPCGLAIDDLEAMPLTLAPNPAQDVLRITSAAFLSDTYSIHLVNQLGQTIHTQQSKTSESQYLNVSGYADGIYFISIQRNGQTVYRSKILKR